jgi:hypothetical protein
MPWPRRSWRRAFAASAQVCSVRTSHVCGHARGSPIPHFSQVLSLSLPWSPTPSLTPSLLSLSLALVHFLLLSLLSPSPAHIRLLFKHTSRHRPTLACRHHTTWFSCTPARVHVHRSAQIGGRRSQALAVGYSDEHSPAYHKTCACVSAFAGLTASACLHQRIDGIVKLSLVVRPRTHTPHTHCSSGGTTTGVTGGGTPCTTISRSVLLRAGGAIWYTHTQEYTGIHTQAGSTRECMR